MLEKIMAHLDNFMLIVFIVTICLAVYWFFFTVTNAARDFTHIPPEEWPEEEENIDLEVDKNKKLE